MSSWFDESEKRATTVASKVHRKYHTYFDNAGNVVQESNSWGY